MRGTRVLIFAKEPLAGRVKTRLIPALGAEGAAALAREMLATTIEEALASGLGAELCGEPDPAEWAEPLAQGVGRSAQGGGDLGSRLARAAERVLSAGENALLIGADCPELGRERLRAAAEALERFDAVIHPAADGGYVLLGLGRFHPSLFEGIAWSTDSVAAETVARVEALGWSLEVREVLRDVDEPADVAFVPAAQRASVGWKEEEAGFPLSRE